MVLTIGQGLAVVRRNSLLWFNFLTGEIMDYTQVMAEIKKGQVRPLYLLHGEETFLTRKVEMAIVNFLVPEEDRDMNLTVFDRDPSTAELVSLIETVPFMGGNNVIIVRGTNLFRAARRGGESEQDKTDIADQRLMDIMADIPEYSRVIFTTADKVDKRRKLYKTVEKNGAVVDLSALKPKDARPWVLSKMNDLGRRLAPDALEHLLAAVSMMPQISLGFLDQELEKIAIYTSSPTISRKELMGIMSAVPEVSVFLLIEAVSQKQVGKALAMLREQLASGENALRLLALLARQVRMLLQGQTLAAKGLSNADVAEHLGVPPFIGEKIIRQGRSFNITTLQKTIVNMAEADRDLKLSRTDAYVLEKIIIEMCR
jgi:DNA polymerase-3 subunit delta